MRLMKRARLLTAEYRQHSVRAWTYTGVLIGTLVLGLACGAFQLCRIEGASMIRAGQRSCRFALVVRAPYACTLLPQVLKRYIYQRGRTVVFFTPWCDSRLEMKRLYADELDTIDINDDHIAVNGYVTHCMPETFFFRVGLWSRRMYDPAGRRAYERLPETLHGTALAPLLPWLSAASGIDYAQYVCQQEPHSNVSLRSQRMEVGALRIRVPGKMFFALSANPTGGDSRWYGFVPKERLYGMVLVTF